MPASWSELFDDNYTATTEIDRFHSNKEIDLASFQALLCDGEDVDETLLELVSDVWPTNIQTKSICEVRNECFERLIYCIQWHCWQLDLEQLCLTDYPNGAALMMQRLLEVGAPWHQVMDVAQLGSPALKFLVLEAARLVGRQEEVVKLYDAGDFSNTTLSELRALWRCGWSPSPKDSSVTRAVAWWKEEEQNWKDYLEDGSYEEARCVKIIERYSQRRLEIAMQSEARALRCVLERMLARSPCDRNSGGCLPGSVAQHVVAFVVRTQECMMIEKTDTVPTNDEPLAHIDPEVAHTMLQLQADENWAHQVEQNLARTHDELYPEPGVFLLRFGNAPKSKPGMRAFEHALRTGQPLEECRKAMVVAGCPVELESGAKIFCAPRDYEAVLEAVAGKQLHPFHVLITEPFEPCLDATLVDLVYNLRPREKKNDRQRFPLSPQTATSSVEDPARYFFPVKRTFIHFSERLLLDSKSVVQSSTGAHNDGFKRPDNHRRINTSR